MRVFYIGELSFGGTCLDRMRSIERLGHVVVPFDTCAYLYAGHRLIRSIGLRFNIGPHVNKLNRDLNKIAQHLNSIDIIWVDKGRWIWPKTLAHLESKSKARIIHYTPDPAFSTPRSTHFINSVPIYHHCFTTKPFEIKDYKNAGARQVHLFSQTYEQSRFYPRDNIGAYDSDVCFIGHFEIHYARRLKAVANTGAKMAIWGPGWPRYAKFARWCRGIVKGAGVWGEEYPKALSSSKICLGLLSKKFPETSTTRTFEIPACGRLLLAERTNEHLSYFVEDKEAVYFDSDAELVKKLNYYLSHSDERDKIAFAGRSRSIRSNYTNDACAKQIIEIIRS